MEVHASVKGDLSAAYGRLIDSIGLDFKCAGMIRRALVHRVSIGKKLAFQEAFAIDCGDMLLCLNSHEMYTVIAIPGTVKKHGKEHHFEVVVGYKTDAAASTQDASRRPAKYGRKLKLPASRPRSASAVVGKNTLEIAGVPAVRPLFIYRNRSGFDGL